MAMERKGSPSSLLLQEYFAQGDDRFLAELARFNSPKALAPIADKWKIDPRSWARRQVLSYLAEPLNKAGHEPIVKRLFKHAEAKHDTELMAVFLVAFDRLVRRVRKKTWQYDWETRQSWEEEQLIVPRDRVRGPAIVRQAINPKTLERIEIPARPTRGAKHLFRYRTRYYLRRRAWRYFRRMGFQRPADYVRSVAAALVGYRDEDFATGENILDNWSLMQICFRHHDALEFGASTISVRSGRSLGELNAAPKFPKLWKRPDAFDTLFGLVREAKSRLVRQWSIGLIRREHAAALANLEPQRVLGLLDHESSEVQQFAAELLGSLSGIERLPIETWLQLLKVRNPEAIAVLCDMMRKHVRADRLSLSECLDLCCATPAPVARTGFEYLKQREVPKGNDRAQLSRLACARCAAVAGSLAEWALGVLGSPDGYDRQAVTEFFDSPLAETRRAAMAWLQPGSPGYDDPQLWACIIETPFDDVRFGIVETLERRSRLPGTQADQLARLWCSVVLGVHRGGRQKGKAVRQIAAAVAEDPAQAKRLVPVLAVAVRSIRDSERRAGLAALVGLIERQPELAGTVREMLPELAVVGSPEGARP